MRFDGRENDQLRPISISTGVQKFAAGSALVRWGDTHVLCTASLEETVPPFRENSGGGWLTAEYNMLPSSTPTRKPRRSGGRETEIQRLIGRALRAAIDLDAIGPRTITIDCDVLQADGGTRVASVTGGFIALALASTTLLERGVIYNDPVVRHVAAVSVGILNGELILDLPYREDSTVEVDLNVVMTDDDRLIDIQGTGEKNTFSRTQLNDLCALASGGIAQLCKLQSRVLQAAQQERQVTLSL